MAALLKSKNVIIKKQQRCFCCLRLFPTGTKMNYWVGIYEGDFNSSYSCMTCVEIMNRCGDEDNEGFPEGYALEILNQGETPEQLIERWDNESVKLNTIKSIS